MITPVAEAAAKLSTRDLQILALLADGLRPAEVAGHLYMSHGAVRVALHRLYLKMGASSAAHAVNLAWQRGLVGRSPTQPSPGALPGAVDVNRMLAAYRARYQAAGEDEAERVEVVAQLLCDWYASWPRTAVTDPHWPLAAELVRLLAPAGRAAPAGPGRPVDLVDGPSPLPDLWERLGAYVAGPVSVECEQGLHDDCDGGAHSGSRCHCAHHGTAEGGGPR